MKRISVVIPTRLQTINDDPQSQWYLQSAIRCVVEQSIFKQGFVPEVIVGVDPGMTALARQRLPAPIVIAEADVRLQAAALNAGIAKVSGDYVAFLEDDDLWEPRYLERAIKLLEQCDFVSSTHLERTTAGVITKILDYPTPSSWVMPRATLQRVGGFDPDYRWHLDSEWIGRLNEAQLRRVHCVEATAPIDLEQVRSTRPNLYNILLCAHDIVSFWRHESPWPLVLRTVHPGSGMWQISESEAKQAQSKAEYDLMISRFGMIPW